MCMSYQWAFENSRLKLSAFGTLIYITASSLSFKDSLETQGHTQRNAKDRSPWRRTLFCVLYNRKTVKKYSEKKYKDSWIKHNFEI